VIAPQLQRGGPGEVTPLQQAQEKVRSHGPVIARVGMSEQVKGDAQPEERFEKTGMEQIHDLRRREAALLGRDGDGRAVGVRAGDHQDVVPAHAVVAGKDVRREVRPGDVAQMQRRVRVWPGDAQQDLLVHGFSSVVSLRPWEATGGRVWGKGRDSAHLAGSDPDAADHHLREAAPGGIRQAGRRWTGAGFHRTS